MELWNGSQIITNIDHIRVADESLNYELFVGLSDFESKLAVEA